MIKSRLIYRITALLILAIIIHLAASTIYPTGSRASSFTYEKGLNDNELEIRARKLFLQVRCVVCEGQSVAHSNSDSAKSMRKRIRDDLLKGKSDEEILKGLADIFGEKILMNPPMSKSGYPLWLLPYLFLLIGVYFMARRLFILKE